MTNLKVQLQETFMKIIQNALSGMTAFGGFEFTEALFQAQQDVIDSAAEQFTKIAQALVIAFS